MAIAVHSTYLCVLKVSFCVCAVMSRRRKEQELKTSWNGIQRRD
jgi:hypothetical protein